MAVPIPGGQAPGKPPEWGGKCPLVVPCALITMVELTRERH
jgi:hypothetical protein